MTIDVILLVVGVPLLPLATTLTSSQNVGRAP